MYIIKTFSQEEGVRNLKRAFQTIIGKLNIIRITKKGSIKNLDLPFEIDDFEFPIEITESIVNKLVENNNNSKDLPPNLCILKYQDKHPNFCFYLSYLINLFVVHWYRHIHYYMSKLMDSSQGGIDCR